MSTETTEQLIAKSPVWLDATKNLNEIVADCNRRGVVIPPDIREAMGSMRVYITLLKDPAVFASLAGDVWETINAEQTTQGEQP